VIGDDGGDFPRRFVLHAGREGNSGGWTVQLPTGRQLRVTDQQLEEIRPARMERMVGRNPANQERLQASGRHRTSGSGREKCRNPAA